MTSCHRLSRRGAPHKEIRHMAEDNFTLTTFYTSWKEYQDHIKGALAPLTAEQLELRAAPHLRSIGENALHIIGCCFFQAEDGIRDLTVTGVQTCALPI